jgi:hypothetical protein
MTPVCHTGLQWQGAPQQVTSHKSIEQCTRKCLMHTLATRVGAYSRSMRAPACRSGSTDFCSARNRFTMPRIVFSALNIRLTRKSLKSFCAFKNFSTRKKDDCRKLSERSMIETTTCINKQVFQTSAIQSSIVVIAGQGRWMPC